METTGEVTQGLEGPSQILLHNRAVSFLSKKKKKKKNCAKIPGSWTKATDSFFLSFFFLSGSLSLLSWATETMWPFPLLPPPPFPLLPPSSSKPAPDLVLSWLAGLQQDSGRLPAAGRHGRRTRPARGQEERGPGRGRQQHEGRRHGGL